METWRRPMTGWVKCNYDVSHHDGDSVSGIGWIICNSQGICLDCGMGKFQGRATTEEAECSALIWAIQCTWALGYRTIEFEGDNQYVNNVINSKEHNHRLRHYLKTIAQWRNMFTASKFTFRYREQNKCADLLAKKAVNHSNFYELYHSCPMFLYSLVNSDAERMQ
ncbi:Ribonuclease H-like superfamily [Arabidopsis suecica]|uniref:Ribonuclease H-like superfamily n=1 Tax=Arabidopsis suecica TaxID=45249 RepID=A0A8T1XQN6_ARASU|nr:Ribonuclease H-like superfamily [Arabidopsis suecica]